MVGGSRLWGPLLRILLSLLLATPVVAQGFERVCLEANDVNFALSLAVDDRGRAHLIHVDRIFGDLLHTVLTAPDGIESEVVAVRMSLLGTSEVRDSGLVIVDDVPRACFYDARARALKVSERIDDEWSPTVLREGQHVGDQCAIAPVGDTLGVAFHQAGTLQYAEREGDEWRVVEVDANADYAVGLEPAIRQVGRTLYIAHRGEGALDHLRVSWRRDGPWRTEALPHPEFEAGLRPRISTDGDGGVWITHGVMPLDLDVTSDNGLMLASGRLPGGLELSWPVQDPAGGSHGAYRRDDELLVVSRERLRSPIFGQTDAIRVFRGLPIDPAFEALEHFSIADRRHNYARVDAHPHPFGEPVMAFADDRGAIAGMQPESRVCIFRPVDRDGDIVPDLEEGRHGTRLNDPDTDGDGRSDGQEILFDFSDPLVPDEPGLPPDAGPDAALPDPDAALPDPDAALPDPDAALPDPDAALPDPDAALPDPDAAQPDPDVALPDPDVALPDPDVALPDPDVALPDPDATPDATETDLARDVAEPDVAPDVAEPDSAVEPEAARPDPDSGPSREDGWLAEHEAGPADGAAADIFADYDLPESSDRGCECDATGGGGLWVWLMLVGIRRRRGAGAWRARA